MNACLSLYSSYAFTLISPYLSDFFFHVNWAECLVPYVGLKHKQEI